MHENEIISLQNVMRVELRENESIHTRNGIRCRDKNYRIFITYMNDKGVGLDLPDNNPTYARDIFNAIFAKLNKE